MLRNLSLKLKLVLLGSITIIALAITIITGSLGIKSGIDGIQEIGHNRMPSLVALQQLREHQVALRSSTYETALWENDNEAQEMFSGIAKDKQTHWDQIAKVWQDYESISRSAEEDTLWKAFGVEWEKWKKLDQDTIKLILTLSNNTDAAQQKVLFQDYFMLGGQQRQAYLAAEKLLSQLVELNAKNVAEVTSNAEQATRLASKFMVILGGAAMIITLILAALITTSILRQMGGEPLDAMHFTHRIAEGDLNVAIPVHPDDKTSLLASMDDMQKHLRDLIRQIQRSAQELAGSAQALTSEAEQVARNGQEEHKAAQSAANAVDSITGQISLVDASADQALRLSNLAGTLSNEGQGVIGLAVREMENVSTAVNQSSELIQRLGSYSSQISSIVSVIKDIADQTNLLALNAAIEAARAGEQGRGFAVVADEVRKLAERTTTSTDEISTVVTTIQRGVAEAVESMHGASTRVAEGVGMVRNASGSMERIHAGAQDATGAVSGIHQALQESSASLAEIRTRMSNIVGMVTQNSGAVATMTESSRRIDELAANLTASTQRFRI